MTAARPKPRCARCGASPRLSADLFALRVCGFYLFFFEVYRTGLVH